MPDNDCGVQIEFFTELNIYAFGLLTHGINPYLIPSKVRVNDDTEIAISIVRKSLRAISVYFDER